IYIYIYIRWQPRWFVLESGVISYYDCEDDVGKGSKGSIKMSVCDIKGQTAAAAVLRSRHETKSIQRGLKKK
uniref:PH domain-containing protein n=1 Tax=Cyclopterus lumpus TaxID=8103 RepID=A0A8C2XIU1_CYCLU